MPKPAIVQAGNIVLRARAAEVDPKAITSAEMRSLVRNMVDVMRTAPGVGLAAPQIGVGLSVIVLEDNEQRMSKLTKDQRAERGRTPFPLMVVFNPQVRVLGDEKATFFEGCLSVQGYMAMVERHLEVEVTGYDAEGKPLRREMRGWGARIMQHEVDHLNGVLYIDKMLSRSFCCNEDMAAKWLDLPVDDVKRAFGIE
ncbi:MAG: peptide deformylase [Polyangiaceae bacterium]|nr:peptide deformylase [Polyangiaceae bacterium]